MIFLALLIWLYHVPQLGPDIQDDSIHQERERYNYQLGLDAYRRLDEKYGTY